MKKAAILFILVGAVLATGPVLAAVPAAAQTDPEILAIIDDVDRMMQGASSAGSMRMEIDTEHWSRSLEMQVWSLGTEHSLIRVQSPAREAGTATLKVENEVWNYLPRADRTIKIPPSMMLGSWMGSHVTNDDLVKESRLIEDYDIVISYEGDRDGEDVWEFTMTPRPEAPVIWGRIEQRIRKRDRMPLWAHYYDEDGTLARTMTFADIRTMGGRTIPTRIVIEPADGEERTVITYVGIEFDDVRAALDRVHRRPAARQHLPRRRSRAPPRVVRMAGDHHRGRRPAARREGRSGSARRRSRGYGSGDGCRRAQAQASTDEATTIHLGHLIPRFLV